MLRLTSFAAGGGCACKIPAEQLETAVTGLVGTAGPEVLVGLDAGDDASAVRLRDDLALISTTDFFTPMLDDPYDWGRVAATNALSDVYAMGGSPVTALNLVGWPVDTLGLDILREVIRGGMDVATSAGISVTGGHSITSPEPIYGMAVSGTAHPDKLMGIDKALPGLPITLTKPIGVGILNNKHKVTGEVSAAAVESMTTLNKKAAELAVDSGIHAATDVTGFGLLGHLYKMCRASGISAELDFSAVPEIPGAKDSLREGFVPGGSRRNLDWVRNHISAPGLSEDDLIFLADAQTSGGLLVVGELPGYPIIGHTTTTTSAHLITVK